MTETNEITVGDYEYSAIDVEDLGLSDEEETSINEVLGQIATVEQVNRD